MGRSPRRCRLPRPLPGLRHLSGWALLWLYCGRRWAALTPILVTQILLVLLLGHQFAFLGLVESSSALLVIFGEFALFTVGITAAFCFGVMWSTMALERLRTPS